VYLPWCQTAALTQTYRATSSSPNQAVVVVGASLRKGKLCF